MALASEIARNHPAVWRGELSAPVPGSHPSGFAALDALLPGGGWPRGALAELLLDAEGIGELRLIMPALSAMTASGAWIAFIAPPYVPYAPALARLGVDLSRTIILEAKTLKDRWWAAEQALRGANLAAVLFWPQTIDDGNLRRLQLAAQTGGGTGFVFSPAARAGHASPAPLRLKLGAEAGRLRLDILKRRGSLVTQPLLLDIDAAGEMLLQPPATPRDEKSVKNEKARYPALMPRPKNIGPQLTKHHANGGEGIWSRSMARADTVKRSANDGRS